MRHRVELPDGDFVDLDATVDLAAPGDDRPLVLVLHGLEGSARSKYALQLYHQLTLRGLGAVGLNFRGCSGELNRLPRFYHSGDTDDLRYVLPYLAERWPGGVFGAVGFSLGGNVLMKYLAEEGREAMGHLHAAVAISVPYDLSAGADHLQQPVGWIYRRFLLRKLQRKLWAKRAVMPPAVQVRRALTARSFRAFDDAATAPLHGFADAETYYRESSSGPRLDAITVPTLLIHAEDDPFLPAPALPRRAIRANPHLAGAVTPSGGHVGFVAHSPPSRPHFWAEHEAARFLAEWGAA